MVQRGGGGGGSGGSGGSGVVVDMTKAVDVLGCCTHLCESILVLLLGSKHDGDPVILGWEACEGIRDV